MRRLFGVALPFAILFAACTLPTGGGLDLEASPAAPTSSSGSGGAGGTSSSSMASGGSSGGCVPHAEICDTPADENCDGESGCTGAHLWSMRAGDPLEQFAGGVAIGPKGGVVAAGQITGSADFGGGPLAAQGTDAFLAAFTSEGTPRWSKLYGDAGFQSANAVGIDSVGNIVVFGSFDGYIDFGNGAPLHAGINGDHDVFLAKLGPDGHALWTRQYGDYLVNQDAFSVAIDPTGDIVLAGTFEGSIDFGDSPLTNDGVGDAFVAKLDGEGVIGWSHSLGGIGLQEANSVATAPAGAVYVCGEFDGQFAVGTDALSPLGDRDAFVAKIGAGGIPKWGRRFGGTGTDRCSSVAADAMGVVVVGTFHDVVDLGAGPVTSAGDNDIMVIRLDPAGNYVWSKTYGGTGFDSARGVAIDGAGNVLVTGRCEGPIDFGAGPVAGGGGGDVFVLKLSPSGALVYAHLFGDAQPAQSGRSVAADVDGSFALIGEFMGSADFGGGALTALGNPDVFVAKFGP